jgi:hypothetical protein
MSLPAVTQLPQTDHLRIHALIKSLASGMIVPIDLAERAYRLGNESCHRTMDDLTESLPEEPLDLSEVERIAINKALAKCRGGKLQTARMLGIGKATLYRKSRLTASSRRAPSSAPHADARSSTRAARPTALMSLKRILSARSRLNRRSQRDRWSIPQITTRIEPSLIVAVHRPQVAGY